jgi:hypothetical protein
MRGWGGIKIGTFTVLAALALAACSDEKPRYNNDRIVERLHLKEVDEGYSVDDDPFCEVAKNLINDADEREAAEDRDKLGLVIASREGNVGVRGVPVLTPDCRDLVRKRLNKLDRPSED